MTNAQTWIKQHHRAFAVIVAAGLVGVFLVLRSRSSSSGQSVAGTILPPATGGGGASGSGGSYYVPPGTITVYKPPASKTVNKLAAVIRGLLNPETGPAARRILEAEYHQLTGKPWIGKPVSDRDPHPHPKPKPPKAPAAPPARLRTPGQIHYPTPHPPSPLRDRRTPVVAPRNPHRDRRVIA